jgi:hypothetical protein
LIACLIMNGLWLWWVSSYLRHILSMLFDEIDRFELEIPVFVGTAFSIIDILYAHPFTKVVSGLLLIGWGWIAIRAWRQRKKFRRSGFGLEETNVVDRPDFDLIKLIGSLGVLLCGAPDIGKFIHNTDCHAEVIWITWQFLRATNGKLIPPGTWCFATSYMASPGQIGGVTIGVLADRIKALKESNEHYAVVVPITPIYRAMLNLVTLAVQEMAYRNQAWVEQRQASREKLISHLPSWAKAVKEWLLTHWRASGYNFWCLLVGVRTEDGWDCISFVIEVIRRASIRLSIYSTVFPNIPQRICADEWWKPLSKEKAMKLQQTRLQQLWQTGQKEER